MGWILPPTSKPDLPSNPATRTFPLGLRQLHRIGQVHQLIKAPANLVAVSQPISLGFGSTDEERAQHFVRFHSDILKPSDVAKNIFNHLHISYPILQRNHEPMSLWGNQKTTTLQHGAKTAMWTMLHPSPLRRPKERPSRI